MSEKIAFEREPLLDEHISTKDGSLPAPVTGTSSAVQRQNRSLRKKIAFCVAFTALAWFGWNLHTPTPSRLDAVCKNQENRKPFDIHDLRNLADPDSRGNWTVKQAEKEFLSIPSADSARATSKKYSALPHLAGSPQDFETAKYFLETLQTEFGISNADGDLPVYDAGTKESRQATLSIPQTRQPKAWIDTYYVALNTPKSHSLSILDSETGSPVWEADLEENPESDSEHPDPAGEHASDVKAWHGLSAGGDVTGPIVFVDYGNKADFEALREQGVNLTGTIALVRYWSVFRGLKIKAAQEAGCVGVLVYSDPRDDGTVTAEQGYLPYPDGPARNPSSVQRGSVQFLSLYPGDPSTEGYPSYKDAVRSEQRNKPSIPSLPISWANAEVLLKEIWGDDSDRSKWWAVDGKRSERNIHLVNEVDEHIAPNWNVMGVIPGHIKDEIVVVGNHRDAWVLGATDPSSGTVSVTEVIRGLGHLYRSGWRPLRTIVIASWDGEEYGLLGSVEYGEDFADFLLKNVVAYINVDVSTSGSKLSPGGSPSLGWLIQQVARDIPHPFDKGRSLWDATKDVGPFKGNSSLSGDAYFEEEGRDGRSSSKPVDPDWTGVKPLGSGSDFTVFLQRIGIASSDVGFGATPSDPVYHYHSVWDSHEWQARYGDTGFDKHVSIGKLIGLQALRIADSIILPLNTTAYAIELAYYLKEVEEKASRSGLSLTSIEEKLGKLNSAVRKVRIASEKLDSEKDAAEHELREALKALGKKSRSFDRRRWLFVDDNEHRNMCRMSRLHRSKSSMKSTFGAQNPDSHRHGDEQKGAESQFQVPTSIPWVEATMIPPDPRRHRTWPYTEVQKELRERDDSHAHDDSKLPLVRLGKAAAGWNTAREHNEERNDNRLEQREPSRFQRVRLGKAAADWKSDAGKKERRDVEQSSTHDLRFMCPALPKETLKNRVLRKAGRILRRIRHAIRKLLGYSAVPRKYARLFKAARAVQRINAKLSGFESKFIDEGGIKDREWYRHLGVAPGKWKGYGATTFPSVSEAIDEANVTLVEIETDRLLARLTDLTEFIEE